MEGKVKWFDPKKGYGFIVAEDGKEVFVHYTGIVKEGFKALTEGQIVSYEIGEGDKGVQAVNVQILPKAE
jgi:CspA family cold shock protein